MPRVRKEEWFFVSSRGPPDRGVEK